MANTREIRRRIKSIKNTAQITKAMQMVAASKMRRAQVAALAGRPMAVDGYQDATWILLDFDSVLAHVFLPGERSYYDLESLWAPAAKRRREAAAG